MIATRPLTLLVAGFILVFSVALCPERPAKLLTPLDGWIVKGPAESKVRFIEFPEQFRQLRRSTITSDGKLFRTWSPNEGIVPVEIISPPFRATPYMSVAI